jgi:DNA-binding CsgD family transcriptional regulator
MNQKNYNQLLGYKEKLSRREIEVLKLICNEKTTQEVAVKLSISKRTVDGNRQRMLLKVGAKNIVGLVKYAITNQIHTISSFTTY